MKRIVVWGMIVLALAALVVYAAWPRPRAVEAALARRGEIAVAIVEEAETRLDRTYAVSMPVAGRLLRIDLLEGDVVDSGAVIARVDTFEREARLRTLDAQVREVRALIVGVDKAKPKPEDVRVAELAVDEASIRLAAGRKALEEARINFEQEEKQFERTRRLYEERTVPPAEFDEAQRRYLTLKAAQAQAQLNADVAATAVEQAKVRLKRLRESIDDNEYQRSVYLAQIDRMEAEEAVIRDELAKSVIRAPVTGPVLEKQRDSQQVLPAGSPLLTIGDLTSLRVEADILSEEMRGVGVGQAVEVSGPAVGPEPVAGTIERIFPAGFEKISSLGIEQQRIKVIARFDDSKAPLRPGVRVDIRIVKERKADAVLVPERAVFRVRGEWHVFVVSEGKARLRPITVGLRNDEWVEVAAGVAPGEVVVLSPPAELADGERVSAGIDAPPSATQPAAP